MSLEPSSATFKAANSLGSLTETIQFNVIAANPSLLKPKLLVSSASGTYTGTGQGIQVRAVGTDGTTSIAGTYAFAYNGLPGNPLNAGTYQALVIFTSLDPSYDNATLLTNYTIRKATPIFSYLSSPAITVGVATAVVSGSISAGSAVPTGDYVIMTLNGVKEEVAVDQFGNFTVSFPTASLNAGNYTVSYAFQGDANLNAAAKKTSTLTVVPLAVPKVTLNPQDITVSLGDPVSFTATATGSPGITVIWQVSTDGGVTFTNITGNSSALTDSLVFTPTLAQSGYEYRAVFTNSAGTTYSSAATLTVQSDSGGGD